MKLTVKPLKQKDAGRGLAAIDRAAMREMELENGDYILIEGSGSGRAVARVWPGYPEDEGNGIIRIDGRLRSEADVGIDDKIEVSAADVKPATSVTVALPQNLRIRGNIGPHIRDKLSGQAVTEGQQVPFSLGLGPLSSMSGQRIPLRIADTAPGGTVVCMDFVRDRSDIGPLFGAHMLALAPTGDTYTAEQYRSWLDGAGFVQPAIRDVPGTEFQAIIGHRPE